MIDVDVDGIRDKIADRALMALSVIAVPALAASLWRMQSIGWQPVMALHVLVAGIIWSVTLFRQRIPYRARAFIIIAVTFSIGVGGFLNFALSGAGHPFFVISVVFAAVLLGTGSSVAVLVLGCLVIASIGFAYATHLIEGAIDFNNYNTLVRAWLTTLFSFMLLGVGAITTIVALNRALLRSVFTLKEHSDNLEGEVAARTQELEQEIKERNAAEELLRDSEERYHNVISNQQELITQFTPDGRFIFVNEAYSRFVGRDMEDLQGGMLYDVVPTEEVAGLKQYFTTFSPERPHNTIENHIKNASGETRYYEWSNSATFDQHGNVKEIQSVGRDITERKIAEEALTDSEERYRSLVDLSPDAVLVVQNFKVAYANTAAIDLFGAHSSDELREKSWDEFIHPDFTELAAQRRAEWDEKGEMGFGELGFLKFDNSSFSGEIASVKIPWEGAESGLLIVRDITKRKEVDRLKSEFLSLVSHELRTPLTSIMGSVNLVLGGALGKMPEKAVEMLAIARANSERLLAPVNDILDFERLQSGRMKFTFEEVDLSQLVNDAVELNRSYAEQHEVEFVLEESNGAIRVKADQDRILQVVFNLLSNAAKFSPAGEQVNLSIGQSAGRARVEVADNGPGIAEDFREKIFDRFSQVDLSDKRAVQGSGLGLSISKAIIDEHHGIIDFESRPGSGTVFFFELPMV